MYEYRAELRKIVDGDTIDLAVDLGFGIFMDMRVRVARIDAWETRGAEREMGKEAAIFVREEIEGMPLWIKTEKDKKGKYGRYIAEIYYSPNLTYDNLEDWESTGWKNLSDELVNAGHAIYVEY